MSTVRALAALESAYDDPPLPVDRPVCFGLRGACTVLTVASFESFLRALFEEELDRLKRERIPLVHYGDGLRTAAIYASLELAMRGDHRTRGSEKKDRVLDVISAARAVAADTFFPRAMASTESNPDGDCVKRMCKVVGLTDIFRKIQAPFEALWSSPVSLDYCKERLDGLLISRHQVAHSADAAHVLRSELLDNALFVEHLATVLSDALHSHIDGLIKTARAGLAAAPTT
ncbi:HEPN domain-containing protein [Actinoplanes sp. NPDC051470]|uniref:HEPN domain-containing protein n=1 Tax=Actinoplanes sp. NPDC051470 TaxID=3157224 RepID=UPI0034491D29